MFSRLIRISRKNREDSNTGASVAPPAYTEQDENSKQAVEVSEPPSDPIFEPVERQRHFGILRNTVKTRFRRLMLIGVANILVVVGLFLFIYFFAMEPKISAASQVKLSNCTNGFSLVHKKCLNMINFYATHDDAASICVMFGGHLFSAKTQEENTDVNTFLKDQNADSVWMGLTCDKNYQCSWDDGGSDSSYSGFDTMSDHETTVTTPSYTEDDEPDKPTVEVCEPPDMTFEPTEHRHFGVIRYTVHTRFRKLMLIGLVNILVVVALFLLIYFTALAPEHSTGDVKTYNFLLSVKR